jgi:outer membrane receptor protein involved in Fe transport
MYMIDRVEVSRGPNSILYGFGSPAGKINVASKQAMTNKNSYSYTNRVDSWGGLRDSIDTNFALLKNKLGLRVDALRGREESWRAAGYNDQDRVFLAVKWQPTSKTTIRAEYEYGNVKRFVPRPFFGIDLKSVWDAKGQPIFDNFPSGPAPYNYSPGQDFTPGQPGTPGTPRRDVNGSLSFNGVSYPYSDLIGVSERSTGDWVVVSSRFNTAMNFKNFTVSEAPPSYLYNDFVMGRANPKAVLEANWADGRFYARTASFFVQQELFRDLNLEFALNRTRYRSLTRNLATWNYLGIAADTNKYLPTGAVKPAANLYYIDTSGMIQPVRNQTDQGRLAIAYEKQLHRYVALRLAAMGEMAETKSRSEILQQYWFNGPSTSSGGAFNPTPENGVNTVYHRFYLDSLSQTYDRNFRLPAPYDLSGATKYQDPRTGAVRDIYAKYVNRSQGNIGSTDSETSAGMLVGQTFLLQNRLVGTFGYRKDRLKTWRGLAYRDPATEAIAPNTGIWTPGDPKARPFTVFSGQTRTMGGVGHITPWLSVFYNRSNSLSTSGTSFITPTDPVNAAIADYARQPSGKTDDYGVKLSVLQNRLFLTATKYHTISKNEFGFSGFNKGDIVNIWNALQNAPGLPAEEKATAQRQYQVMNQVQGYMQDSQSRGAELELVGRITNAWSVSVNYSKNETLKSNIANEYRAYLDHWKPYWKKYQDYSLFQTPTAAAPAKAVSSTDWRSPADFLATGSVASNVDSVNEAIAQGEQRFYDNPHIFEGKPFVGDPRHSINLRTRYDFRGEFAKGLSVGGGTRLRKGRIAGARTDWHVASGSDPTDTWNGRVTDGITMVDAKDQNVYDLQVGYSRTFSMRKIRWEVQLNVNNLTDQRELIVNNIHPQTLAPMAYRYQDPRQFILTNTFSF